MSAIVLSMEALIEAGMSETVAMVVIVPVEAGVAGRLLVTLTAWVGQERLKLTCRG